MLLRAGRVLGRPKFPPGAFTLGRDPSSGVVLADIEVSRTHARIDAEADRYVVVDAGSRNGISLDGTKVERAVIRQGSRLDIGPFTLVVQLRTQEELEAVPGQETGAADNARADPFSVGEGSGPSALPPSPGRAALRGGIQPGKGRRMPGRLATGAAAAVAGVALLLVARFAAVEVLPRPEREAARIDAAPRDGPAATSTRTDQPRPTAVGAPSPTRSRVRSDISSADERPGRSSGPDAQRLFERGERLLADGRLEAAADAWNRAFDLETEAPSSPSGGLSALLAQRLADVEVRLSEAALRASRYADAYEHVGAALELVPDNGDAVRQRAELRRLALEAYAHALAIFASNPEEARALLAQAVALTAPDEPPHREAEQRLHALPSSGGP